MANEEKKEQKQVPQNQVNALGTPDKIIPKFCSQVNIGLANNNLMVMSLMYSENNNQPTLIERVIIDLPHAKQIVQLLNDLLSKAEKAKTQ